MYYQIWCNGHGWISNVKWCKTYDYIHGVPADTIKYSSSRSRAMIFSANSQELDRICRWIETIPKCNYDRKRV